MLKNESSLKRFKTNLEIPNGNLFHILDIKILQYVFLNFAQIFETYVSFVLVRAQVALACRPADSRLSPPFIRLGAFHSV